MTTAEKLTKVAENIPKVYEAGYEKGKAEGDGDGVVELADVTLTDLQKQGRLTLDGSFSILSTNILDGSGTAVISVTGNVEFTLKLGSCALAIIKVDGKDIYSWDQLEQGDSTSETVEYSGKVNESIAIAGGLFTGTFERLAVENNYDKGVADGKQAEYDRFWDALLNKGLRTEYMGAFGCVWTDDVFKPKYDIRPVNANTMFEYCGVTDLKAALEKAGVTLDFSNVSYGRFTQMFQSSQITRVGVIDTTGSANQTINYLFYNATKLREIEKWVITEDGKQQFGVTNTFQGCSALEEIRIEGMLGCSLSFQPCTKLTDESLLSILTALSKDSTFASGKSITFATASQAVIEADAQCTQQYNLALAAGWEIIFA